MSAKTFLLQECVNVKDLLEQTLRHEYGLDGSQDFFQECTTRLEFIRSELSATEESDADAIRRNGGLLNDLSALICRIERSSLGEYSWPFVEELKKMAVAICTEATLASASTPPKVYVLADGGLDKYAIYVERRRPSASQLRILTIVFPKSLKHFVLLHSILGHEIGHAIWRCSKHQKALKASARAALLNPAGLLKDKVSVAEHIYSAAAPIALKDYLYVLSTDKGITKETLFEWANWEAWIEEILCDLIGLSTFGPSFAAAQCELLYGLDPSGVRFGDQHPPAAWRVNLILRGARILGYDLVPDANQSSRDLLEKFWQYMDGFRNDDPWHDVSDQVQLRAALTDTCALLAGHPPSGYASPSPETLDHLLPMLLQTVPPVGFSIGPHGEPLCTSVDFRHILYAGWIVSRAKPDIEFEVVNKLCEHAIMQQHAIDISLTKNLA